MWTPTFPFSTISLQGYGYPAVPTVTHTSAPMGYSNQFYVPAPLPAYGELPYSPLIPGSASPVSISPGSLAALESAFAAPVAAPVVLPTNGSGLSGFAALERAFAAPAAAVELSALPSNPSGKKVVVLGSCFIDNVCFLKRAPDDGETLHADEFVKNFGGKGGNQAVQAGKLGANVAMMGMVGSDEDGRNYIENLKKYGVNADHVKQGAKFTGLAQIWVSTVTGENRIAIFPGASNELSTEIVDSAINAGAIADADIVICQNEVPPETTYHFLKLAHNAGKTTIFNPAPAPEGPIPDDVFPTVSIICLNEHEAGIVSGVQVDDAASAEKAAAVLREKGAKSVVVTLGAKGCLLMEEGTTEVVYLDAPKVQKVVDTTGAGDSWIGSMAYFLSVGKSMQESCKRANQVAGISVQSAGTQPSYPLAKDLPEHLME